MAQRLLAKTSQAINSLAKVGGLDDALAWLRGEYGLVKFAVFKEQKEKTGKGKR